MQPGHPRQGGYAATLEQSPAASEVLARRCDLLLQRLTEVEQALAVQEWWLLGRGLPEARLLAEIASLLAVARGELEHFLAQFFGRAFAQLDTDSALVTLGGTPAFDEHPEWLRAAREQALGLLRMAAAALPGMRQFAQTLKANAQQLGLAMAAVDALSIVAERLDEAYEALQEPPR